MDFNSLDQPQYLFLEDKWFGGIIKEGKQAGSLLPCTSVSWQGLSPVSVCITPGTLQPLPRMGHKQLNAVNNAYPEL